MHLAVMSRAKYYKKSLDVMALMVEIDYIRSFHQTNRFTLMNFIRSRLTLNVKLLLMILNQG